MGFSHKRFVLRWLILCIPVWIFIGVLTIGLFDPSALTFQKLLSAIPRLLLPGFFGAVITNWYLFFPASRQKNLILGTMIGIALLGLIVIWQILTRCEEPECLGAAVFGIPFILLIVVPIIILAIKDLWSLKKAV